MCQSAEQTECHVNLSPSAEVNPLPPSAGIALPEHHLHAAGRGCPARGTHASQASPFPPMSPSCLHPSLNADTQAPTSSGPAGFPVRVSFLISLLSGYLLGLHFLVCFSSGGECYVILVSLSSTCQGKTLQSSRPLSRGDWQQFRWWQPRLPGSLKDGSE